jgi:hypothetical protein
MTNCKIKMLAVRPEIIEYGFEKAGPEWGAGKTQWYKIIIPQSFRGKYTLYLCEGDICGVFQGMSTQDHDFDRLMDKLAFRSSEAVEWTKKLLDDLKAKGIIDFEVEAWEVN